MAEANTILQNANKLVEMKRKIGDLLEQMALLKSQIKPYIKFKPLKTTGGTVSYVEGSSSTYLKKDKMRQVLMDEFKLSEQMAQRLVENGGAKKVINSYVKVTTE